MNFFIDRINEQVGLARTKAKEHGWRWQERPDGEHTIGDLVRAVLSIDNPEDATAFYAGYLAWLEEHAGEPEFESMGDPAERERVAKANIGWCFGEGMAPARIMMWNQATGALHPVFAAAVVSPEEAFRLGMERGRSRR